MVKIFSKSCEHILRIMSQIPQLKYDQVFLAKDICRESKVPEHSARKGLQLLVQQEILKAVPGPGGGYEFKIHPQQVPLLRILELLDGKESFKCCILGLPDCNNKSPCSMHGVWKDLREKVIKEFKNKSLFDLMKKDENK